MKPENDLNESVTSSYANDLSQLSTATTTSYKSEKHSDDSDDDAGPSTSQPKSRKEKSLGKLCSRFLKAMGESVFSASQKRCNGGTDTCPCPGKCTVARNCRCREIHLETMAKGMNTEKRRIYDIVNVMEALDAMCKGNKSFYQWNTLAELPIVMQRLEKDAISEGLVDKIDKVQQAMLSLSEVGQQAQLMGAPIDDMKPFLETSMNSLDSSTSSLLSKDKSSKNSLAILCSRFLMVLLANPKSRRVSLDVASTVLIKETEKDGCEPPSRSRCRRLYDIANVLVALGLVKKVHYLFGTKKIPVFEYIGPEPTDNEDQARNSMTDFIKQSHMAEPGDFTWIAIFGAPPSANSTENALPHSSLLQPLNLSFAQTAKPKRTVLGEIPLDNLHKRQPKKRRNGADDENVKENRVHRSYVWTPVSSVQLEENKENVVPGVEESATDENKENAENALPRPTPRNPAANLLNPPVFSQPDEPPVKRALRHPLVPGFGLAQPFGFNPFPLAPLNYPLLNMQAACLQLLMQQQQQQQHDSSPSVQVTLPHSGSPKAFKPPTHFQAGPSANSKANLFR